VTLAFRVAVGSALAVAGVAALAQSSPEIVAGRQSGAIGERYDDISVSPATLASGCGANWGR
jgi:hypothetical protein